MRDKAYAKINLSLDVFNIREDGYHDIKSIMIPLNFYDVVDIEIANHDEYSCNNNYIKFNEKNSIIKMINVLKEKYNINDSYRINLNKVVPMQAGLGGGTSDAASTLRIFKKLYNLDLSKQEERDICVAVGADVLFNYYNVPAVVSGIGDFVEPFNVKNEYNVLIVKPRTGVSTKQAYETLDMNICDHPNIDELKEALVEGKEINGLLGNSLEQPALILNKDILNIKNLLKGNGCKNVLMSGSGSSVFAISTDYEELARMVEPAKKAGYYARLTKTRAY